MLQSPLSRLITDKHTDRWQHYMTNVSSLGWCLSLILEWAGSGSWPRDSDQQPPHLAVIKDAETRVWDEECKVRSLITRGDMAGITLHLTLVITNSLRVNQARVRDRSFLLSLVFASRGRSLAGALGRWSTVGIKMIKQDSSICMKFNLSDTPGKLLPYWFLSKNRIQQSEKISRFLDFRLTRAKGYTKF